MKEKIRAILSELRPDVDFDSEQKLIDDAILDSFDIVTLVFELNDAFDLDIDVEELIPEMSAGEHSNIGVLSFALGFTLMMALDVALA